ncbi:MAG: hypothetical protein KA715_07245 [Xanthomonadaceae bacterium]|nr:hypothetical protein [Xanthomonadaceae bacterium]
MIHRWSYSDLDTYQRQVQARLLSDDTYLGEVIYSEVDSVITVGKRSKLQSTNTLAVDRGGLETWHGPGQLVIFPVVRMIDYFGSERALKRAITSLLKITFEAIQNFKPEAKIEFGDRLGIWTDEGKIASIGIAIKQGVLLHGVAINLYPTSQSFAGINPCGIENAKPDFCLESKNDEIFSSVKAYWEKSFVAQLPLLRSPLEQASVSLVSYRDPLLEAPASTSF